jgi:hypothetical protein
MIPHISLLRRPGPWQVLAPASAALTAGAEAALAEALAAAVTT